MTVKNETALEEEDAVLVEPLSIASGDEVFCRLFLAFYSRVHSFFRRRGLPTEDCRDLTQETFLRVYRGIGRLRSEEKIRTWLFQIAGNVWHNETRHRATLKRGAKVVQPFPCEPERPVAADALRAAGSAKDDPLDDLLDRERSRRLRQAIMGLPPQMRRCMLLRVDQELRYREIALVMRLSIDTVKSQIHQARERLTAQLGGEALPERDERQR